MELTQLQQFKVAAETGNISRAAEKLYISQPALSQSIKRLEEEIGAPLFDRYPRRIELTELGGVFLPFAQQIVGYGRPGDVFLGISTSGNSKNIMRAAAVAKAMGLKVISLTGRDGGRIRGLSDCAIIVPEQETYKIQELHLPVYHALCLMLEETFFTK